MQPPPGFGAAAVAPGDDFGWLDSIEPGRFGYGEGEAEDIAVGAEPDEAATAPPSQSFMEETKSSDQLNVLKEWAVYHSRRGHSVNEIFEDAAGQFNDDLVYWAYWTMSAILHDKYAPPNLMVQVASDRGHSEKLSDNLESVKMAINTLLKHYLERFFPTTKFDYEIFEAILLYLKEHIVLVFGDATDESVVLRIFLSNLSTFISRIKGELDRQLQILNEADRLSDLGFILLKDRWWARDNLFPDLRDIHQLYTEKPPVVVDPFLNMYRNDDSTPEMPYQTMPGRKGKLVLRGREDPQRPMRRQWNDTDGNAVPPGGHSKHRKDDRLFNIWLMYCYEFRDLYKIINWSLRGLNKEDEKTALNILARALVSDMLGKVEFGPLMTWKIAEMCGLGETDLNPHNTENGYRVIGTVSGFTDPHDPKKFPEGSKKRQERLGKIYHDEKAWFFNGSSLGKARYYDPLSIDSEGEIHE
jgi:hypothetical protein